MGTGQWSGWRMVVALVAALTLGVAALAPTPASAGLVNRWSFSESGGAGTSLIDSQGGAHGTIVDVGGNDGTVGGGQVTLAGGAQGSSDYVDLPDGLISGYADVTIETWATQHSVQNWSRIFDFGQDTTNNLIMSWTRGTNINQDRLGFKVGSEHLINEPNAPYTLDQQFHIALTIDGDGGPAGQTQLKVYKDGVYRGTLNTSYNLSQLNDINNWLGRSQYGDNTANASWNEFRIYNEELSEAQLLNNYNKGPDVVNVIAHEPEALPAAPVHRWSFGETGGAGTTLIDSIGGAHGTIVDVGGNDGIVGGGQVTLAGGAQGSSDYVDLPDGLVSGFSDATIETWATQHSVQNWSRIFDFGQDTSNNMLMAWTVGGDLNADRAGMKVGNVEQSVDNMMAPYTLDQEFHIVMTIDENAIGDGRTLLRLYRDGELMGGRFVDYVLSQVNDVNNWLGRSQYGDNTANASWNEFRIYDYILTDNQILGNFVAGPDAVNVIPEPATLALLGAGALALIRRRRKS